ncbi:hypothetical protein V8C35DRAFT_297113 [Trichoderma chlorosporum]
MQRLGSLLAALFRTSLSNHVAMKSSRSCTVSKYIDARACAALQSTHLRPGFREATLGPQPASVSFAAMPFTCLVFRSSSRKSRRLVTLRQACTRDGTVATAAGCMSGADAVRSRPGHDHELFFLPLSD